LDGWARRHAPAMDKSPFLTERFDRVPSERPPNDDLPHLTVGTVPTP
jgi:hypothetical protein